ncbi:hypothetical protein [Epilithonimonas hungarica]|uniref:hypothetical protein n=1 Tax=Epilithonimonas hungarica TaxID=454006 RepID=UPI001113BB32|nr:hypothetical protein [Epilithonimonas hungarica]
MKQNLSFWKHRPTRIISLMGVFFLAIIISAIQSQGKLQAEKNSDAISKYIEANKNKPYLNNLKLLEKWDDIFESKITLDKSYYYFDDYSKDYKPLDTLKDGSITYGLFLENNKNKILSTEKYIKPIKEYGQLKKYFIKFTVNKKFEVTKSVAVFENDKKNVQEISDPNFDLSQYANLNLIKIQTEMYEKTLADTQKKQDEVRYAQELTNKKANWEKECISGYDGSCKNLVRFVKPNLPDPSSFEHIDTAFKRMDDYVLVIMKYRTKNTYGALVIGVVTAKVSYDCEVLEINQ